MVANVIPAHAGEQIRVYVWTIKVTVKNCDEREDIW